ncbi:MAG: DMT family transporter [Rubrivivax sp.]|nr:DMT family transporter [Rubrivivax sp.]
MLMHPQRRALVSGTLYAAAAGLTWGLVFVAPSILADYPPALLAMGRYLAFGLIALPLALWDRQRLAQFSRADWLEALKLSAVGNLLYYLCLAAAIQNAGVPLPTMIIGTLPVVIAVVSNLRGSAAVRARDGRLPWRRLAPSLLLIGAGIACVNRAEWAHLQASGGVVDAGRHLLGMLLAVGAVLCWTWYAIRNADWLRAHAGSAPGGEAERAPGVDPESIPDGAVEHTPGRTVERAAGANMERAPGENLQRAPGGNLQRAPGAWATAQGLATLPLAVVGYALWWGWTALAPAGSVAATFAMPLGPRPELFLGLMLTIGLMASWLGTLCWNAASQRLPPALAGQLIVFESLAALAYAFVWRGQLPGGLTLLGITLLLFGVLAALRGGVARAAAAHGP